MPQIVQEQIVNPCRKKCCYINGDCSGCFRTAWERSRWHTMGPTERNATLELLKIREMSELIMGNNGLNDDLPEFLR